MTTREPTQSSDPSDLSRHERIHNGPYSGRLSGAVGYLPPFVLRFVVQAGGMAGLLVRIVWSAVRYPRGYWAEVSRELHQTIKRSLLPVAIAIFGFLIFSSILAALFLKLLGAAQLFGPLLFIQSTRSFTVWVTSMVVAGVIGAALTADIGSRKVREELDAMEVMGIDPVRELAVPRVVSLTLFTTMLAIPTLFVTMIAMQVAAGYVAGLSAADFYSNLFDNQKFIDIVAVVLNCILVGLLIGSVCCYKGFVAEGGPIGLGRAVNQAVVVSFVSIWVLQLGYQAITLGLYTNPGEFR